MQESSRNTQNSSLLDDLFEVLELSSYVIEKDLRYFKCVQDSSKGEPPIGILGKHRRKTGVHYHKGNDRAPSSDRNELEKYSNIPWNLRANTIQTWDQVRGREQFHRYHDIATTWQTYISIDWHWNNVVVPKSQIQLIDHQLQELLNRIDPLSDDGNNGINHFLDTVAIIEGFID